MEIENRQLEALLQAREQQAQLPKHTGAPTTNFENLLNRQMEIEDNANGVNSVLPPQSAILNGALLESAPETQAVDPDMAALQAAIDNASGALDIWDSYAKAIGGASGASLRDAYAMLEGIDSQVERLKASPVAGTNAALDGVINELEILSITEKFKFNRGDYLA